jgi:hypothetical protein
MLGQAQAAGMVAAGAASTSNGRTCLNVPAFYVFAQDIDSGELRLDFSQTVASNADFWWRGWKYFDTGAGLLSLTRFRLLSGYYLSNVLMPMSKINLRSVTPEMRIPAGGFIGIESQNNDSVTRKLKIVFYGVERYYI